MQLQSKKGHMVCDYYPVKTWDNVQHYDKVLRILTFMGQTMSKSCLLYTSPSPRDRTRSRMPSSA